MPPVSVESLRSRLANRRGTVLLLVLAVLVVLIALTLVRSDVERAQIEATDAVVDRALRLPPPGVATDAQLAGADLPAGTWLAVVTYDASDELLLRAGSTDDAPDPSERPNLETVRKGLVAGVLVDDVQRVTAESGGAAFRVRAEPIEGAELESLGDAFSAGASVVAAVPADAGELDLGVLDDALRRSGIVLVVGVLLLMVAMRFSGSRASEEPIEITDHAMLELEQPSVAPPVAEVPPDAAPIEPNGAPVDLQRIVRDAVVATGVGAETTTFVDAPPDSTIVADASLVRELVDELLDNALRHGGEDVRVDLRIARAGADALELHVIDSGPGMGAAARARALEWPWKKGAGRVGIAFVRAVADAHRGTVDLAPVEGGGLHVTVVLRSVED